MPETTPPPLQPLRLPLALLAALLQAACVTPPTRRTEPADPLATAVVQPLRDLSLVRSGELPLAIRRAAAQPYRPSLGCHEIQAELETLRAWLGPDVDPSHAGAPEGSELAVALLSSATALPFRGVVRRLTGAHRRDEAVNATIVGALVRRGFLNGEQVSRGCRGPEA